MTPPFDIFRVAVDGQYWLGTAATPADAVKLVQELSARSPSDYLIFHQQTGRKFVIKYPGAMTNQSSKEFADVFKTLVTGR